MQMQSIVGLMAVQLQGQLAGRLTDVACTGRQAGIL